MPKNGPFAASGHMVHAGGQAAHWNIQNKATSNLVPRVSPLHAPGSERGETLVGAGHVSPKIWEIINKWLEGGAVECQFAHTKCTWDGKTCRIARVSKVMSSGPETPKKVYKASESVNVGCCRFCKSVGDTGNLGEIFTAKQESTTSGGDRGAFIRPRTSTMLNFATSTL